MVARYVYFVRATSGEGPVKIGCSEAPLNRLAFMMVWSPEVLEVVATLPGSFDIEHGFHAMFESDHLHHEWFRSSERLEAVINEVRAGAFDVGTLPSPKIITRVYRKAAASVAEAA